MSLVVTRGVEQGRRMADIIVLEGLFGTPSNPTFAVQARKLLAADQALNGGANANVICRAMTTRGILALGECGAPPRGEITIFQSATSTIRVSDSRAIDDIAVRVQTEGFGAVTLVAPDGTTVVLTKASQSDATFGLNALPVQSLAALRNRSAAGDWKLIVDGARLRSWSLLIKFAGDAPQATRPMSDVGRKYIPAVAHVLGAANTLFLSDVWICNRSDFPLALTAIFTPSAVDGMTQFAAVQLAMEPRQIMVLNDVIGTTLQTSGTGQLEVLGNTDRFIATSRAYTPSAGATYGQTIPSFEISDAGANEIAPLQNTSDFRSNVGAAEISGDGGVVRFTFFNASGAIVGSSDAFIPPFGHIQTRVPVVGSNLRAEISILAGTPRLIAYGSVVDNLSGDAITIPAFRLPQQRETVAVPVIHAAGAGGTTWRTDLWRTSATGSVTVQNDAGATFGTP